MVVRDFFLRTPKTISITPVGQERTVGLKIRFVVYFRVVYPILGMSRPPNPRQNNKRKISEIYSV